MKSNASAIEAARTRKWVALLAVIAGILVQALNQSIIQAALPTLSQELGANFTTIQWVLLSFQITWPW